MSVAEEHCRGTIFLHQGNDRSAVAQPFICGIVRDEDRMLPLLQFRLQNLVHPQDIFRFHMTVPHFHVRARIDPDEQPFPASEQEAVAAPQTVDRQSGAFRPVCLMIPRNKVIRKAQPGKTLFHCFQFGVRPLIGDIAGNDREIISALVDLIDHPAQSRVIRRSGAHMKIGQQRKTRRMNIRTATA